MTSGVKREAKGCQSQLSPSGSALTPELRKSNVNACQINTTRIPPGSREDVRVKMSEERSQPYHPAISTQKLLTSRLRQLLSEHH